MLALSLVLAFSSKSPQYLAVGGLLIGCLEGHVWRGVEGVKPIKKTMPCQILGLGKLQGTWIAFGVEKGEPNEALYFSGDHGADVYFSGTATFPRPVKSVSASNPTYVSALASFLRLHGVKTRPRLTQAVSVDLDGDGTQEVILTGQSRDDLLTNPQGAKTGDYSVVLLRALRGGKVVTIPMLFDHPTRLDQLAYEDRMLAIADLDGDEAMELVVKSSYYEGMSGSLFRYRRGRLAKLVEMGDGV